MGRSGDDGDAALREVADALYAAPSAGFVARRAAGAKEARSAGDRDLAARIGALPKPSASAALLNALAHGGAEELQRLLDLGDALRDAQQQGDRERLRALGADRRRLLTEVADRAVELAGGKRPGDAVLEEVQQTLQAALADDDAADAVRSGRLVRALAGDGLEPADVDRALAVPGGPAPRRASPMASQVLSDDGAAEARTAAQRAADRARARADALRRRADALVEAAGRERAAAERAASDAETVRGELERVQRRLDEAEGHAADAQRRAEHAERDSRAALEQAEAADAAARQAARAR